MTVSLALLKSQLNVDHDADDALLSHKIAAAEAWTADYLGKALADFDPLPATITEAILQLAAHWYECREAVAFGNAGAEVPFGVRDLLRPYREWGV
jgi:uncharacterized phage protein (predicted DNA packaging)